jgi:hypothetical protein
MSLAILAMFKEAFGSFTALPKGTIQPVRFIIKKRCGAPLWGMLLQVV